ncbi:MAG: hypothetical protein Q8O79_06755 [Pseudomonadota bacterium]|nr:hypothetical protein [Pseudomonadota bacterium]
MKVILKNLRDSALLSTLVLASSYGGASYGSDSLAVDTASAKNATKAASGAGLGDKTSGYIRDYLSDPRRSGSLAGSILGGAMFAHPAGPIVGSVVGFFVGKNSMFNEDKARAEKASLLYVKRDIVPQNGQATPTLSFANAQGITFDTPSTVKASQVSMPVPVLPRFSSEQIAAACGGKTILVPHLRGLCFYSQGS